MNMALNKLTCPECGKVLKPARPVEPGKKVRCPGCDEVFIAPDEDEDDDQPMRDSRKPTKAAKATREAPSKKKAAAPAPAAGGDDDGAYGVVRDEADEDNKPHIEYAPDTSIKDLRGPAVALLMPPTNKLTMAGFIGVIGALVLIVLLAFPALLPVTDDLKEFPVMKVGPGLSQVSPWAQGIGGQPGGGGGIPVAPKVEEPQGGGPKTEKIEDEPPNWYRVYGIDFGILCDLHWALFLVAMFPLLLLGIYSALVSTGGIKAQNLESRTWGIVSSIMAMIPFNTFCPSVAIAILIKSALLMMLDDDPWIHYLYIMVGIVFTVFSIAAGIWTLITLNDEDVIAGFEYEGE
jgi:hypothetical protein